MAAALSPDQLARIQAWLAGPDGTYLDPVTHQSFQRAENPQMQGYSFMEFRPGAVPGTLDPQYDAQGNFVANRPRPKKSAFDRFMNSSLLPLAMLALPFALPALGFGAAGAAGVGAGELAGAAGADVLAGGAGADVLGAGALDASGALTGGLGGLEAGSGYGLATLPELGVGGGTFGASALGLPEMAGIGGFAGAGSALGSAAGGGGSILTGSSALTGGGAGGVGAGYGITPGALGTAAATTGGASGLGSLLPGGLGSLITPAAQVIGGALTANAAGNAADAMAGAANAGIAENRRQFDLTRQLLQPYVDAGTGALGSYQALSGAGGTQAQQAAMAALEASPQYASLTKAGENAILQNASATGGLRGGNVQGALADQRTTLLGNLVQQQLNRYAPLITGGQASAAGVGAQGMAMGQNNAQLLGQAGAANAGGIVAGNNAITGALGNVGGFFAGQQAQSLPPVDLRTGMNFGSAVLPSFSSGPRLF